MYYFCVLLRYEICQKKNLTNKLEPLIQRVQALDKRTEGLTYLTLFCQVSSDRSDNLPRTHKSGLITTKLRILALYIMTVGVMKMSKSLKEHQTVKDKNLI